eukprot:925245-Pelagomonas_calceolata.AAC.3
MAPVYNFRKRSLNSDIMDAVRESEGEANASSESGEGKAKPLPAQGSAISEHLHPQMKYK